LNQAIDTPGKLLDAAERLFAAQGYGAVSLRQIIADAGVNVAAVHYHFGSKQDLLDKVVIRKAGPVNQERMARFDRIDAASGGKPRVERVFEAFLAPMAEAAGCNPEFVQMMGRLQAEGILSDVIARNFQPMLTRFLGLLRRATPDLSETEFRWRVHFCHGAVANAMCGGLNSLAGVVDDEGYPSRIERLIAFLSGGFAAPASRPDKPARHSGKSR
jgi:AcrR family transcriptional regulator